MCAPPVCALFPHSASETSGVQICREHDDGSRDPDRNGLYPSSCGGDDDDGGGGGGPSLVPALVLFL